MRSQRSPYPYEADVLEGRRELQRTRAVRDDVWPNALGRRPDSANNAFTRVQTRANAVFVVVHARSDARSIATAILAARAYRCIHFEAQPVSLLNWLTRRGRGRAEWRSRFNSEHSE